MVSSFLDVWITGRVWAQQYAYWVPDFFFYIMNVLVLFYPWEHHDWSFALVKICWLLSLWWKTSIEISCPCIIFLRGQLVLQIHRTCLKIWWNPGSMWEMLQNKLHWSEETYSFSSGNFYSPQKRLPFIWLKIYWNLGLFRVKDTKYGIRIQNSYFPEIHGILGKSHESCMFPSSVATVGVYAIDWTIYINPFNIT